jgi:hypothetical protein
MTSREQCLNRATEWQDLAESALNFRDRWDRLGLPEIADFWQAEYQDRAERARYWLDRANAPAWKRWFA